MLPYSLPANAFEEFELMESSVRYYCRSMRTVFTRAVNARVWNEEGNEYIDFLSACASLNYGHNHPALKSAVLQYLNEDGLINGLDLHTVAKREFIRRFREIILEPRALKYRLQFPGPTGTNAVEAALKLARKVTGRRTIVSFTNAFHGMTLGALSLSGNPQLRFATGVPCHDVVLLPFEGNLGAGCEELDRYAASINAPSGGMDPPAAFIVEAVQGEGGLNVASKSWLQHLAAVSKRLGALLIVDDIQAGCGRTGSFFSFEQAGIAPDLVCLSKSLSGLGLPMSLVLIKPEYDRWAPGEHTGTFRGNNLAFVSATAALEFWTDPEFVRALSSTAGRIRTWTADLEDWIGSELVEYRGIGVMSGLAFANGAVARFVADEAFRRRLLVETAGPDGEVLKLMPPLTIEPDVLEDGLHRLEGAIELVFAHRVPLNRPSAA